MGAESLTIGRGNAHCHSRAQAWPSRRDNRYAGFVSILRYIQYLQPELSTRLPNSQTLLRILAPWPPAMPLEVRFAIEKFSESPSLQWKEQEIARKVAIGLWKAGPDRLLKDGRTPEIMHYIGVACLVEEMRLENRRLRFAVRLGGLFHDAVEDELMTPRQLQRLVINSGGDPGLALETCVLVQAMTHAPHVPLDEYRIHALEVVGDPDTRLIKACDLCDRHANLPKDKNAPLFVSEQKKNLIYIELFYQTEPTLAKRVENSARDAGLLPVE